jgi:hypothetical protein
LACALIACDGTQPQEPAARHVAVGGGSGQAGVVGQALAQPYEILVTDAAGAPLAGVPVAWAADPGSGSLATSDGATDAQGRARATHRLGNIAGTQFVRASVSGAPESPLAFTATAQPDGPAQAAKVGGDGQAGDVAAALPAAYAVRVTDQFGNPAPAVPVTFTALDGGVAPPTPVTDAAGVARATHTLGAQPGPDTVVAVVGITGDSLVFVSHAVGQPALVAQVLVPANYGLHDTFVRDGLAFACVWNTGIIVYDVGNGMRGGTPSAPVPVDTIVVMSNGVQGGPQVHNAWWFHNQVTLEQRYLFVGQEGPGVIGASASGDIHVIDVSDLTSPVEVAFYRLNGAGTHNFWMDEQAQVLYAAFYNGGVVALDVSGQLAGNLASREIARIQPGGAGNTFTWGVQLDSGSVYAVDMLSGVWQLRLNATSFTVLGGGNNVPERFSSDFWVHGGYAYSGTWGTRSGNAGNTVKVWQLGATGAPSLVHELVIPGIGTVSDIQVSADGALLVFSAEGGPGAGLYVYGLEDPAHPTPRGRALGISLHTATVANVNGRRYAFAAKNPGLPALAIFDITDFAP